MDNIPKKRAHKRHKFNLTNQKMDSTESKPLKKKVKKEKLENSNFDENKHKSKKVEEENQPEDSNIVKMPNTIKNEIVDSDSSEDGETECAAKCCCCPSDEKVAWVQCDKCQQWFHILCVGLTHQAAEAMDVFVCVDCITIDHGNSIECPKNAEIRICSTS